MILLFNKYKKNIIVDINIRYDNKFEKKTNFLFNFFTRKRRYSIEFTRFESLFFLFDDFIVVDNFSITINNDSKQSKNKKRAKKIVSKKTNKDFIISRQKTIARRKKQLKQKLNESNSQLIKV